MNIKDRLEKLENELDYNCRSITRLRKLVFSLLVESGLSEKEASAKLCLLSEIA